MALTGLTTLPQERVASLAADFLKRYENGGLVDDRVPAMGAIHDDGLHIPTVGYGLNLKALPYETIASALTFALTGSTGGTLSAGQQRGLSIIRAWKADTAPSTADDIALIRTSAGLAGTQADRQALKSLWLTDATATRLLDAQLSGTSGLFPSLFNALDARLAVLGVSLAAASQERLVLTSLYYNAPNLIGPGIATAIATDDHARFWYEIRYNHQNYTMKGLQNRREAESNSVDILAPADSANVAATVKAMATLFDRTGGAASIYEKIAARDKIIQAGDPAQAATESFAAKIAGAMSLLSATYAKGEPLHFVQVGGDGNDVFKHGVARHLGLAETATNDLVLAGNGTNTVKTGGGNDWVTSGTGRDRIDLGSGNDNAVTGAGNDRIDGGAGHDSMNGGTGYDTYIVDAAGDTVIDPDRGAVETRIALSALFRNIDSYTNLAGGLKHTLLLDPSLIPTNVEGIKTLAFKGSAGSDTYRFALTGETLDVALKTGTGKDVVSISAIADPDKGTTAFTVTDAARSDRFDFSALDAVSIKHYDRTDPSQIGQYVYTLAKEAGQTVMEFFHVIDGPGDHTDLHLTASVSSKTLTMDMFVV